MAQSSRLAALACSSVGPLDGGQQQKWRILLRKLLLQRLFRVHVLFGLGQGAQSVVHRLVEVEESRTQS
jgi:hypothetical protein